MYADMQIAYQIFKKHESAGVSHIKLIKVQFVSLTCTYTVLTINIRHA